MSSAPPSDTLAPRRAVLFSGHMIDAPDRPEPRFPAALEPAVGRALRAELDAIGIGADGVAVASAACGGDILFDEAVLERGVPLCVYLPFDEPTFIETSVGFASPSWTERYRRVVARATLSIAPEVLGPLPAGADAYARTNLWMLAQAQRLAGGRVVFLCLWNGEGGDGPGGTQHMMDAVRSAGGEVHWIDIRKL